MEPPFDKIVINTLGNEFGYKSKLFQQFIYYILEEKLKDIVQFKMLNDKPYLTIYNIPDEETGSIINDFVGIIEPIIFYKLHDFAASNVNETPNLDRELYQRILPQSSGYDSEPPRKINKKTENTSYIKFENYCGKSDVVKKINVKRLILGKAIEYDLQHIINDCIKNHTEIIDCNALKQVIKTHNMSLFNQFLPLLNR